MDYSESLSKDIVQISRLAMTGKSDDIQKYLARARRRYKETAPDLYEQIGALLRETPTRSNPIRKKGMPDIPVDLETRLPLLQCELFAHADEKPILAYSVLSDLESLIAERQNTEKLLTAGLTPARTALFVGPPGVGKTLSAKWLAERLDLPLLTLDLAAVMSSFLGKTGNNIRNVLDYAKDTPCILLLDEIDAIAKRRDDGGDVGELKRLVTVILQEIDRWPASSLMIAATNHEELLDPAIWRRFDYVVRFPSPAREEIALLIESDLESHTDTLKTWKDILIECFIGDSFSEIKRSLTRYRRACLLEIASPEEAMLNLIQSKFDGFDRNTRIKIAKSLVKDKGVTQRKVAAATGLSRDTIRKYLTA